MQVRPSRGNGSIVGAALSRTAIAKVHAEIDAKVQKDMTWEDAGKAIDASLDGIEYSSKHDVVAMLQKMASKGLKAGVDESLEKEAQHWIGRGLNWMADQTKGIGQGIGDAAKGVGDWAKGKMDSAQSWQQLQPQIQAIRQALDFIEKNPNSLRGMMPQIIKHVRDLSAVMPKTPAPAPTPFSGQTAPAPAPAAAPAAVPGFGGMKTLPL